MAGREAAKSDMANRGCGFAIECTDVAPALSFGVEVLDAVTDASEPIPAKRFDRAETVILSPVMNLPLWVLNA